MLRAQDPKVGTLAVGIFGELRKVVSKADVRAYASLLGDDNPIHLDDDYAKATPWGRTIAHGMISAGLIPTIFGSSIPGCVYVSQELRFTKPVYVGDAVIARVEVREVRHKPHLVTCDTTVRRESDGVVVIEGKAVVKLPPLPKPAGDAAGSTGAKGELR